MKRLLDLPIESAATASSGIPVRAISVKRYFLRSVGTKRTLFELKFSSTFSQIKVRDHGRCMALEEVAWNEFLCTLIPAMDQCHEFLKF
jgi:hypothetical protein